MIEEVGRGRRGVHFFFFVFVVSRLSLVFFRVVCFAGFVSLYFGLALPGQAKKQSKNRNILLMFLLLGPGPT